VLADYMLGNHGNERRDFKLASKLSGLEGVSREVIAASGKRQARPKRRAVTSSVGETAAGYNPTADLVR